LLERLLAMYEITEIYHLAALLSTRGEFTPETAHEVNVNGTLSLLKLAAEQARSHGQRVRFIFPSSIAVYGMPNLESKSDAGAVTEDHFCNPITMYGCNKLYCEQLGHYYARYYKQLSADAIARVDFRCVRFPGLISAVTIPSGGTSDYAPEMIHAAAQDRPYACFVRPDTRMPFMAMPDAVAALLALMDAPSDALSRLVYNVAAFSPDAAELAERVRKAFPRAQTSFAPDVRRQAIVDSWPEDVDDARARHDWGFRPAYDLDRAFDDYLLPNVTHHYARG
jgi:nucleoside-diphosphate-sugar epimerase